MAKSPIHESELSLDEHKLLYVLRRLSPADRYALAELLRNEGNLPFPMTDQKAVKRYVRRQAAQYREIVKAQSAG
jgi:hypothetical protein